MNKDLWNNVIVPALVIIVAVAAFLWLAVTMIGADPTAYGATDPAQERPFDHSNCQYPNRTTNPPDGCDNSDPCDPANTKGGSGECNDVIPTIVPTVAPAASQRVESSTCGGK
jgi:hypothetical protein